MFTLLVTSLVPGWGDLAAILKVLLTTLVLTPLMAYFVLPWVTRILRPWLQRLPGWRFWPYFQSALTQLSVISNVYLKRLPCIHVNTRT